jgi:hypothetical protein
MSPSSATPLIWRAWFFCAHRLASFFPPAPPSCAAAPLSLVDLAEDFSQDYEIRLSSSSGALCLRQRMAGSYGHERRQLARFLKQALTNRGMSHLFSDDLVNRFRSWLVADAAPIAPGELLKHNVVERDEV